MCVGLWHGEDVSDSSLTLLASGERGFDSWLSPVQTDVSILGGVGVAERLSGGDGTGDLIMVGVCDKSANGSSSKRSEGGEFPVALMRDEESASWGRLIGIAGGNSK